MRIEAEKNERTIAKNLSETCVCVLNVLPFVNKPAAQSTCDLAADWPSPPLVRPLVRPGSIMLGFL